MVKRVWGPTLFNDVITDFTVGWLRTKNLVYTDIYMHFLFNLHASVYILTFTCIFYLIYMQVYVWSMQNIAEGLRRPERLWLFIISHDYLVNLCILKTLY